MQKLVLLIFDDFQFRFLARHFLKYLENLDFTIIFNSLLLSKNIKFYLLFHYFKLFCTPFEEKEFAQPSIVLKKSGKS